jgi:hypothetical protein
MAVNSTIQPPTVAYRERRLQRLSSWSRQPGGRDTSRDRRMASDERSEKAETGMVPEVANLGIVRPPFVYLCAIVLGLLLHFAWPVRLVSRAVSVPLGGTLQCWSASLYSSMPCARFGPLARPFRAIVLPPRSSARGVQLDSCFILR